MAEGTYEYECMRAELLGIEKPDEAEFEKQRLERLQQELESHDEAEAQELDDNETTLQNTGGKLDELNTILSSTQQKLNRFKQTACTSLSNIFSRGSLDLGSSEGPSTSATASRRNTTAVASGVGDGGDFGDKLDAALDSLDEGQPLDGDEVVGPRIPTEKIRAAKTDIQKKMTSQLGTLDQLINKAEQAEMSMTEQSKQMRKMAK